MMVDQNPYSPPSEVGEFEDDGASLLPIDLLRSTRRAMIVFSIYQFTFPLLTGLLTNRVSIDLLVLVILASGIRLNRRSLRRFPKTLFLFGLYLLAGTYGVYRFTRSSATRPFSSITAGEVIVNAGWLISIAGAIYCIHMMWRCYQFHRSFTSSPA